MSSRLLSCGASSVCRNEVGAYDCYCQLGTTGDGTTCAPSPLAATSCFTGRDEAWLLTGTDFCARFGLTCNGMAIHYDSTCGTAVGTSGLLGSTGITEIALIAHKKPAK